MRITALHVNASLVVLWASTCHLCIRHALAGPINAYYYVPAVSFASHTRHIRIHTHRHCLQSSQTLAVCPFISRCSRFVSFCSFPYFVAALCLCYCVCVFWLILPVIWSWPALCPHHSCFVLCQHTSLLCHSLTYVLLPLHLFFQAPALAYYCGCHTASIGESSVCGLYCFTQLNP